MSFSKNQATTTSDTDVVREELHFRRIDIHGFRRSDGLFEVEGQVIDQKPYDFSPASGEYSISANEPIHNMGVRLVFDEMMVVHDVQTFTSAAPYDNCAEGGNALQSLKGLRITAGWSSEVHRRIPRPQSCTHLIELLKPLATTAIQTMSMQRSSQPEVLDDTGRPKQINSCYAYAADGKLVMRRWPEFHRPALSDD